MSAQANLYAECAELERLTQRLAADFERILAGEKQFSSGPNEGTARTVLSGAQANAAGGSSPLSPAPSVCPTETDVGHAQKLYEQADAAWRKELVSLFGGGAYNAMYRKIGQGEPGSLLRELFDAREAAAEHFRQVEMDYCRGDAR